MLSKLSRKTLAEQAAHNLLEFIETQDLKPGQLLPSETKLAADFGVSRPIIREALKSLEGKGIVEVVSGKGAVVKSLDSHLLRLFFQRAMRIEREAIIDLMELRKGIEVQSAVLAAQRRTLDDLASIGQTVAEMRRTMRIPEAYVDLDVVFHLQVAGATHNTMIVHLVDSIREALKDTLREAVLRSLTDEQHERVQVGHEAILTQLERGDAEASGQAMALHFDEAIASLIHSANRMREA